MALEAPQLVQQACTTVVRRQVVVEPFGFDLKDDGVDFLHVFFTGIVVELTIARERLFDVVAVEDVGDQQSVPLLQHERVAIVVEPVDEICGQYDQLYVDDLLGEEMLALELDEVVELTGGDILVFFLQQSDSQELVS